MRNSTLWSPRYHSSVDSSGADANDLTGLLGRAAPLREAVTVLGLMAAEAIEEMWVDHQATLE